MAGPFGWGFVEEGWRKGPWTAEEDKLLIQYVSMHGEGRWNSVSMLTGLKRNGKSCRLRWVNYLRPDLKRGQITPHEENIILELHARWGNRWSTIARSLPGRTDNEIKNYWRTHFKKNTKSSQGLRKSKSQIRRRQQQQKQLQQQQQNQQFEQQQQQQHADMTKVMPQLEEGDYKVSTVQNLQNRPEMVFMYPNLDDNCLYSMLNGDYSLAEASFDESVWGSLWNFYDPHAEFDYNSSCATSKAMGQDQVTSFYQLTSM